MKELTWQNYSRGNTPPPSPKKKEKANQKIKKKKKYGAHQFD